MFPAEIRNKRILLSPLNWGMGHVARCIPLIDLLIKNENKIIIAANEVQSAIIRSYFPNLDFIEHAGYPFDFGGKGRFEQDLFRQLFKLKERLSNELKEVERLVEIHEVDLVISDHRYGFRSSKCHSICLTHQLNLPVKWYEGWVQKLHHNYLMNFDELWVPDSKNSEFSGNLSRNDKNVRASYIGTLSRFSMYDKLEKDIDRVIVVSGPSVYANQFWELMIERYRISPSTVIIAPEELCASAPNCSIEFISSLDWKIADSYILRAKKLISRSGYSTLMDIHQLQIPFEVTATPGQREQEYLAELWNK